MHVFTVQQIPGGDEEAAEDLPHGAGREPGGLGSGRLPVPALHMGQCPASR